MRARGVGLEGQPRHVVHQLAPSPCTRAGWPDRAATARLDLRLGFAFPLRDISMRCSRSRTLVKYWSSRSRSRAPTLRCRSLAWPATASRMLWPSSSLRTCASISAGVPCRNMPLEDVRRLFLARNQHARSRSRKGCAALLDVDAERQRREAREMADAFGDVLVERDGVAEPAAARMRRGGEEAVVRRMPAVHVGMRHAAEDGEVVAVLLQQLRGKARARSRAPSSSGKKCSGSRPRLLQIAEHPARLRVAASRRDRRPRQRRLHRVEQRQRQHDARAAQETAAGESARACRNEWSRSIG